MAGQDRLIHSEQMTITLHPLDIFSQRISFAAHLIDDFTGQSGLMGATTVSVEEQDRKALRNPSGYYVFSGIQGNNVTMLVKNMNYLIQEVPVTISTLNPRLPVVSVVMRPRYLYPFPSGTTMITGRVFDSGLQTPLANVAVKVVGATVNNKTDEEGRFVLYFTALTEDNIKITSGKRLISINTSTTIQLYLTRTSYVSKYVSIGWVEEGRTKLIKDPILLSPTP